jgi:hypothetical protein
MFGCSKESEREATKESSVHEMENETLTKQEKNSRNGITGCRYTKQCLRDENSRRFFEWGAIK